MVKLADILIKNACIITMDEQHHIYQDGAIAIDKSKIVAIGKSKELLAAWQGKKELDAAGGAIFPGLINTHAHLFQVLLKGLGRDKSIYDWANSSVRPSRYYISPEMAAAASVVGCLDLLHSGTTTVLDFQYLHDFPGMDKAVIEAIASTGIRQVYARGLISQAKLDNGSGYQDDFEHFLADLKSLQQAYQESPLVSIAAAPSLISDIPGRDAMHELKETLDSLDMRLTMHINETIDDNIYTNEQYKLDCIPLLAEVGLLNQRFIAAHCVKMTAKDKGLLRAFGAHVSHNPISNMILASGVAPIAAMQQEGIPITIATDGAASNDTNNMLEVLKMTALLQKCSLERPEVVTAEDVLTFATRAGAKALGLDDKIGSLEIGKEADLFIFKDNTAGAVPMFDPISALVYSSSPQNIVLNMVAGQIVLADGKSVLVDEEESFNAVRAYAKELRTAVELKNTHWQVDFQ